MLWDYAMQCGFYRRGLQWLSQISGYQIDLYPIFIFIVQEVTPPYCVGQFQFDEIGLEYCDLLAVQAIEKWAECVKRNEWPGYPAGVNRMETPYYVRERLELSKT